MHGDQAGSGESGQRLAAADQCGESERRKQLPEPTIRVRIGRIPGETHQRIVRGAKVQKERTTEEADDGQEKRKDGPSRKPVCKHGEGARQKRGRHPQECEVGGCETHSGADSESAQLIQQAPNSSIVQEHQRLIREGHVSGQDEAAVEKAFLGRESQVAAKAKTGTNEHR
jgi:hypothetical protein